jgi:hypothetical protein
LQVLQKACDGEEVGVAFGKAEQLQTGQLLRLLWLRPERSRAGAVACVGVHEGT